MGRKCLEIVFLARGSPQGSAMTVLGSLRKSHVRGEPPHGRGETTGGSRKQLR